MDKEDLKEKELINDKLINYGKKYSTDKKIWWPFKGFYAGKKYYVTSNYNFFQKKQLINFIIIV